MNKPLTAQHSEWLSLVEVSGPFLTLPVLKRALPMGLDPTPLPLVDDLRVAWKEVGDDESLTPRWIRWVLSDLLELPDEVLKEGTAIGPAFTYTVPEHSVRLRPDFIVVDPDASSDAPARLLVTLLPAGTELDERLPDSKWSADAVDRMAELCRGARVRLGLVTNGDQWALVDAPLAGPTGVATWDANLWLEERITLDAFTTLLGVRRFFSVAPEDTLEAMLAESANAEAEVTDQLGKQVRQAVELLVDAMSRANRDRGGHLFDDLTAEQVYEAAVTVMMRLVFLLSAEERGLFLLGDETYDSTYAVSTLRGQLQEEANTYGEEVIARRTDAWHRLLATFRMVYGGAQHENLRLPAYGGSLFDPDRFPILEGRKADESWRSSPSHPLPIDNRTVLHILGALQVLTFKDRRGVKEARRLSFRALDVEQIGHVYEGLLDHSAVRVDEVAIGLGGKKDPEVALAIVEAEAAKGRNHLVGYLADLTGLSANAVDKLLTVVPDPVEVERLISACDNDHDLADRVVPYVALLRLDLAELPTVFLPDSLYVTQSSDRRSSGTYYTPKALAEEMVVHALEPLVYAPGLAEGVDPVLANLKSSTQLLELKICDMAMGSGAFLVAACRYLSAKVLEAWESEGHVAGDSLPMAGGGTIAMPIEESDREILARRLVADNCLYGVDRNAMAVEMAKLSMWLVTLAKDRPFTFVDHSLRCGDSLLGIWDLSQLECFHLDPAAGRNLHGGTLFDPSTRVRPLIDIALEKRRTLESFPVLEVRDAERKRLLLEESDSAIDRLKVIADVVVGAAMSTASEAAEYFDARLLASATDVSSALDSAQPAASTEQRLSDLRLQAAYWLDDGRPPMAPERMCVHWPLEFPEVFLAPGRRGFDAIIGNPPFSGGKKISGGMGATFRDYLIRWIAEGRKGNADLSSYFLLRALSLGRCIGLITTNTISQGETRAVSLDALIASGWIVYRAVKSRPWPGGASVVVAQLWATGGGWSGPVVLDDQTVSGVSATLEPIGRATGPAHRLFFETKLSFTGSVINGDGFFLSLEEAQELIELEPRNRDVVFPFLGGDDVNIGPDQSPRRWIINFHDWPLARAEEYSEPMRIVREKVKPFRDKVNRAAHRERWWIYGDRRPLLYSVTARLERVLVMARASWALQPILIPTGPVFGDKLVIFGYDDFGHAGVLMSDFHRCWAMSRMKPDGVPTYSPNDCFETFPQPAVNDSIVEAARAMSNLRHDVMSDRGEGLKALYNRVHDREDQSSDIANLRESHVALDYAVAGAYGWVSVDLGHGFSDTRQGSRYTFASGARAEILDRLLELNHSRFEEQGIDGAVEHPGKRISPRRAADQSQLSLDDG